ncbi:MAG: hypothetical protein OQK32_03450 [Gammaproteobacteria bacterium]|nr:hypothetical protein [Gammaproteobacteria bacterium]
MNQTQQQNNHHPDDHSVTCTCGHPIYDGEMLKSRCVDIHAGTALCRCKKWVEVPIRFNPVKAINS